MWRKEENRQKNTYKWMGKLININYNLPTHFDQDEII